MCKHFFLILTTLILIDLSVQQSCEFSCLSDALSDVNCVNKYEIKANATTINKTEGIVHFEFNFGCSVDFYKIKIFYNKNNCNDSVQPSTYRFKKIRYSNETNIDLLLNKCTNTGSVFLQNIQTGFYEIIILDERDFILYENCLYLRTSYIRQEIDLLKTRTVYDSRNNGTELIFTIKNPILKSHPGFSLQFECNNCSKHLSKENSYKLMQNEFDFKKLVLNPTDNNTNLNISCDLKQNESDGIASCVISPVTVGYYNIVITFVGDPYKCAYIKPEDYKIKFQNIVVKADEHVQQPRSYFESIIGPLLAVIYTLLTFSVLGLIIKLTRVKICKLDENTNNTKELVNVKNTISLKMDDETKLKLLLLYARNSQDVMKTLSSFRNIFIYQGIQVYDIYDVERLKEINENNFNWILNLTSRKDIKIIIFLTPSARNLSGLPQVQDSVDTIYPFAIKQLLNQLSNNSDFDKKIFVVHFSNDDYKYTDYDLFSPNLRFRIPDDLMALLQNILNTDDIFLNNKSSNEYDKLMDNYKTHKCYQENIINCM